MEVEENELVIINNKEMDKRRGYNRTKMIYTMSLIVVKSVIFALLFSTLLTYTSNSGYRILSIALCFLLILEMMRVWRAER